jgi:hypothetical protein
MGSCGLQEIFYDALAAFRKINRSVSWEQYKKYIFFIFQELPIKNKCKNHRGRCPKI